MPSIRLTENHRRWLRLLARNTVKVPDKQAAYDAAYAAAAPLVRKLVEKRYPPEDMKLLAKYDVAGPDCCIRVILTAGGVEQFEFRTDEESPWRPDRAGCRSHLYQADDVTTAAVQAYVAAMDALREATDAKLRDYNSLIGHSKKLEEVEAVWPAATALRATLDRTLPVTLSEDVIARIRADVAAVPAEA